MIIGISGLTYDKHGQKCSMGAGKDEVARILVENHGFVRVALADVLKRMAMELWNFTPQQMFGASHFRNEVDNRYGFTPRSVLQKMGTDISRTIDEDVWVRYATKVAKTIMKDGVKDELKGYVRSWKYSPAKGLEESAYPEQTPQGVAFSDARFLNELEYVKKEGGKLLRVKRPANHLPNVNLLHSSETQILCVDDSEFDIVIDNDGTIQDLVDKVDAAIQKIS